MGAAECRLAADGAEVEFILGDLEKDTGKTG